MTPTDKDREHVPGQMTVDECIKVAEADLKKQLLEATPGMTEEQADDLLQQAAEVGRQAGRAAKNDDPAKPLSVQDVVRRKLQGKVPE